MKIDAQTYASKRWRTQTLAQDFELLDAWEFPIVATGEPGQGFEDFCALFGALGQDHSQMSRGARWLFALRERLGRWFGWDEGTNTLPIPGEASTTLRDRLTEGERVSQASLYEQEDRRGGGSPFRLVYRLGDEQLAEISNTTVHAMMHLVWAERDEGGFVPRMGVYVKRRGWFGALYMAAIAPFRLWVVYPALMRQVRGRWQRHLAEQQL